METKGLISVDPKLATRRRRQGRPPHPGREKALRVWARNPAAFNARDYAKTNGHARRTVDGWVEYFWGLFGDEGGREAAKHANVTMRVAMAEEAMEVYAEGLRNPDVKASDRRANAMELLKSLGWGAPERSEHRETRRIEFVVKHEDSALEGKTEVDQA